MKEGPRPPVRRSRWRRVRLRPILMTTAAMRHRTVPLLTGGGGRTRRLLYRPCRVAGMSIGTHGSPLFVLPRGYVAIANDHRQWPTSRRSRKIEEFDLARRRSSRPDALKPARAGLGPVQERTKANPFARLRGMTASFHPDTPQPRMRLPPRCELAVSPIRSWLGPGRTG